MRPATLGEVASALGATLVRGDGGTLAGGVTLDSRLAQEGDLFFALRGRTDGADFAPEAYLRGAAAAVATRPLEVPTLVVDDALCALQRLARWSLEQSEAPPQVIGITGSVGKTTTKDALATMLRAGGRRVSATAGNFNNEIGLPLTVLAADPRTEILVLEMGATHAGDIRHLCTIAPPAIGVLTAIAPVHLDSFGSLEALAAAKGELALALPPEGTLVYPVGVLPAATGGERRLGRRIGFGREAGEAELWASGVEERQEGLRFVAHLGDRSAEVRSPVFGTHLVEPLLAALGGALAAGLDLETAAAGAARLRRTGLRGELYRLRDDILVYDDSYNASPVAVAAVLRYASEHAASGSRRLVAVLGGMFELGYGARDYHREAGKLADAVGVDLLVCVGDEARWYAETFSRPALFYPDAAEAARGLREHLQPGDYVVVKGSRGVGLDVLTRTLKESLALV